MKTRFTFPHLLPRGGSPFPVDIDLLLRRKGSAGKNLAGALHANRVGCTLSVVREVKMEIPDDNIAFVWQGW